MRGKRDLGRALALGATLLALAPASAALAIDEGKADKQLRQCVSEEREQQGVKALRSAKALTKAARFHAKNMARRDFFDHIDPEGNGPEERVGRFSNRRWTVGENIGAGYRSGRAACRGWMNSSPHRANILGRWDAVGVGFASGGSQGTYYVLVFGARGGG